MNPLGKFFFSRLGLEKWDSYNEKRNLISFSKESLYEYIKSLQFESRLGRVSLLAKIPFPTAEHYAEIQQMFENAIETVIGNPRFYFGYENNRNFILYSINPHTGYETTHLYSTLSDLIRTQRRFLRASLIEFINAEARLGQLRNLAQEEYAGWLYFEILMNSSQPNVIVSAILNQLSSFNDSKVILEVLNDIARFTNVTSRQKLEIKERILPAALKQFDLIIPGSREIRLSRELYFEVLQVVLKAGLKF